MPETWDQTQTQTQTQTRTDQTSQSQSSSCSLCLLRSPLRKINEIFMRKFVNFFSGLSCLAFTSNLPSLQWGDNTKGLSYTILGPSIAVAQDTSYSFFIHEHTKIIQMKIIKIQIERKTKHFLPLLFAVGGVGGVTPTPPSPLVAQPSTDSRNKNKYIILHAGKTRARRYTEI